MPEDLLTDLMVHYMTDHLNWKLYIGQDLLGLLSKKQRTWGQGEIDQSCKDYASNHCRPSSATNIFCRFFQLYEETLFLTLHGEDDQELCFTQGRKMT